MGGPGTFPSWFRGEEGFCPVVCPGLSLKCSVSAGTQLQTRLEGQTGTRLWKSLDAMLGSLTLLSYAEERTATGVASFR